MDRANIQTQLTQAEVEVAVGERLLEKQRRTIAALEGEGHATPHARQTLEAMRQLQSLYTQRRDSLLRELSGSRT